MGPPERTYKTHLTDGQLLLLDFLVQFNNVGLSQFHRKTYHLHMNCLYSHVMPDDVVEAMLDELVSQGLVRREVADDVPEGMDHIRFEMTPLGGEAWETEREPDWSRFVSHHFRYDEEDDESVEGWTPPSGLEVRSQNLPLAREYIRVRCVSGFWTQSPDDFQIVGQCEKFGDQFEVIEWKRFPGIWRLSAPCSDDDFSYRQYDGDYLCRHRTWWESVTELIRTQREST